MFFPGIELERLESALEVRTDLALRLDQVLQDLKLAIAETRAPHMGLPLQVEVAERESS
jgi:hypothetical protein